MPECHSERHDAVSILTVAAGTPQVPDLFTPRWMLQLAKAAQCHQGRDSRTKKLRPYKGASVIEYRPFGGVTASFVPAGAIGPAASRRSPPMRLGSPSR